MMYKYCIVPKCTNTSVKTPDKLFFNVPKAPRLRKKWCSIVKRDKTLQSSRSSRYCCEDHFDLEADMENYIKFKLVGGQLKLKNGVFPHKFECQKPPIMKADRLSFKKKQDIEYFEKVLSKDDGHEDLMLHPIQVVDCEIEDSDMIIQNSDPLVIPEKLDVISRVQKSKVLLQKSKVKMKTSSTCKRNINKKTTYHENNDLYESFSDGVLSDTASSISVNASDNESSDLDIIKTVDTNLFKQCMQKCAVMAVSREPKLLTGIPHHSDFCIKHLQNFTGMSLIKILVTLRKIRWNEPNSILAIQFGVAESSVSKYINEAVPKIAHCLKELIIFPSADNIRQNLPVPFRKRYSKTTSIIDCLEIKIEKPSNDSHQVLTWSQYKNCNTIKYLISITPDGLINFISEGYGGRTPDSTILEDSGFLAKLAEGSTVLADRGFRNISHLLEQRGCMLLRLPSVSFNSKSTEEEVLNTKRIADLRVHAERSIGQLSDYKMIGPHACVDISYMKMLDRIVTIACGIINLQDCFSQQV